jgi:hypothetical protein
MKPNDIKPETFIIGGKAMAKLIDAIADVYCSGPNRWLDSVDILATAIASLIENADMEVKLQSVGDLVNFDNFTELSDIALWLQESSGSFQIAFLNGYDGKHAGGGEQKEVTV